MQEIYDLADSRPQEGAILAGKYRLLRVLGQGGMGVVVAAQHLQLDETVAIKFLLPAALSHPEAAARFLREAKAAIRIKSEHVVHVSDVGTLDNGAPYMVMEYLEGGDLAQWLHQRGALDVEQAVEFVLQALEAIADAHGMGIVHRDLKPANLFCVRRSDGLLSIKVLDFGISKLQDLASLGSDLSMTAPAATMGSPFYMSPEQMRSARDVDARTDIWAIGVVLYELLTGTAPFPGDTLPEVCLKAASKPPTPIRKSRPDLPLELEAVVLKCLEKDREQRYANVAELAAALRQFAPKRARNSVERISRIISNAGISSPAIVMPPSSERDGVPSSSPTEASWGHTKPRLPLGRVGAVGGLVVLCLAAASLVTWLALRRAGQQTLLPHRAASAQFAAQPAAVELASSNAVTVTPVPTAPPSIVVQPISTEVQRSGQTKDGSARLRKNTAKAEPAAKRDLFASPH